MYGVKTKILICRFCNIHISTRKSGLTRHEKHCVANPERVPNNGGRKGLNGDPRLKHSDATKKKISAAGFGRTHTIASKEKISEYAKKHLGGYKKGSGRGKKGWYKGQFCDSSWELAFLIYCESNGVAVIRNTEKFPYEFGGKSKNYIPDFIVNGKYVEIKGYITDEWKAKKKFFPYELEVLTNAEMKSILAFVISLHGKNFIKLYDQEKLAESA